MSLIPPTLCLSSLAEKHRKRIVTRDAQANSSLQQDGVVPPVEHGHHSSRERVDAQQSNRLTDHPRRDERRRDRGVRWTHRRQLVIGTFKTDPSWDDAVYANAVSLSPIGNRRGEPD